MPSPGADVYPMATQVIDPLGCLLSVSGTTALDQRAALKLCITIHVPSLSKSKCRHLIKIITALLWVAEL